MQKVAPVLLHANRQCRRQQVQNDDAVFEFLVKMGVFLKNKVCMLPVGHTHENIDAWFGRLNRKFVEAGTCTVTTTQGLELAKQATKATRALLWIKVILCAQNPSNFPLVNKPPYSWEGFLCLSLCCMHSSRCLISATHLFAGHPQLRRSFQVAC